MDDRHVKALEKIRELEDQIQRQAHGYQALRRQYDTLQNEFDERVAEYEEQLHANALPPTDAGLREFVQKVAESRTKFAKEARGMLN